VEKGSEESQASQWKRCGVFLIPGQRDRGLARPFDRAAAAAAAAKVNRVIEGAKLSAGLMRLRGAFGGGRLFFPCFDGWWVFEWVEE
jgi:hypothetical protein